MMRRGQVARWTIAVLSAGALAVVFGRCAVRQELPPKDLGLGQRLAVPPCDEDGARVELVGVRRDPFPHKPSIDIENYLVDLRARSDAERWLIINQDTASSGVDSVGKEAPEPLRHEGGAVVNGAAA